MAFETQEQAQAYWKENLGIMGSLLAIWFLVSYGAGILFVDALNTVQFGGFKLGFWFAQQGSIYTFVALIFIYVARMNALDKKIQRTGRLRGIIMGIQTWTFILVGITFALYIGIAIWARAGSTSEFYVAGGGVHPVANGMATAADWMSAASFISMAGIISFVGYDGAVYLMGWTGGYVLLALCLAPYLRKFGKFTCQILSVNVTTPKPLVWLQYSVPSLFLSLTWQGKCVV